ncbi:MAG TPA: N-acetylmuramoyl-L-alanine amidase [Acidimicrobiales bacterium]|nr:N-acetylmuramoyl-L-alanine amidase [Acidimicrobiales bacterium]
MAQLAGHPYIPRAQWGARPPTSAFVRMAVPSPRLWIHHAGTEQHGAVALRDIQRYHQVTRGWKDIAYNFVVDDDGTIYEGRGAGIAGGATAGDNSRSHAVCLLGNFENRQPTPASFRTLVDLCRHGQRVGWWVPTCGGHRDAPGAQTACPGRHLYARLPEVRRQIAAPTPGELREEIIFQSTRNGAALLLSGGTTFLIESSAALMAHTRAGIPVVRVSQTQFNRYVKARAA